MVKRLKPFEQGFNSGEGSEGYTRATADWVTNALRMRVPADHPERMTVAAAFISREEFLHGKWIVAINHTLAHLSLAADDALEYVVTADQDHNVDEESYLDVIEASQQAQIEILAPMKPFVEAVDKFQLLSVIDEEFVNAVQDTYEAAGNEEATDEFDKYFYNMHEEEIEIATGQQVPSGDDTYVNPLYFHALSDIVVTDWAAETEDRSKTGGNTAQGRAIAEAVARATLDVPYPVEPLGTDQFAWFDALRTPKVELAPIPPENLVSEDRYPMSRAEFKRYLGDYPKSGDSDEGADGEFDGTLVDEIDFEYTYEDAKHDWVARAFVNARKALDHLRNEEKVDLSEIDPEELRQLLVERVHDVDIGKKSTMRKQPTALLNVPRQVETNTPDEDVMSAEGKPLPKVLMEAFEHQGSFGGVIYNLSEEDIKYQLNWHIKDRSVDPECYQHVPDASKNYAQLWHHYYFWEGMNQHLWNVYHHHREQLIKKLVNEFNTKEETERLISQVHGRLSESLKSDYRFPSNIRAAADSRESEGVTGENEGFPDEIIDHSEKRTMLEDRSMIFLKELADERGLQIEVDPGEIICPICNIRSSPCGADGECMNKITLSEFESILPSLIEQFTSL